MGSVRETKVERPVIDLADTAKEKDLLKNGSGYSDPTAYHAIRNMDNERARFEKFLGVLFSICELSGYHIEERIVVKDLKTGRIWR